MSATRLLRRSRMRPATTAALALAAIGAVALAVTGLTLLFGTGDPTIVVQLVLGLVVIVAAFLVPVQWLPAGAIAIFTLVPMRLIPNDGPFNALPPLAALLVVWVFRRLVLGQNPNAGLPEAPVRRSFVGRFVVLSIAAILAAWLVFALMRSMAFNTSVGWVTAFVSSVLAALLVLDARVEAAILQRTWIWVGGILGAYAVVEFALQTNVLYSALYAALGSSFSPPWSVYRAMASFAHPLFAASYFVIPALLGLGSWLRGGRRWDLVLGLAAAGGVVAAVSRGPILALGVAVGALLVFALASSTRQHAGRLAILAGVAIVGLVGLANFQPLVERTESLEGQRSAGARDLAAWVAGQAAALGDWLGTGPGTSGIAGRFFDDVVIENSGLQLLISIGIPGLVLVVAFLGALVASALANRQIGVAAAIIGYAVAVTGFNVIDAVRSMHLLLGLLALLALHPPTVSAAPGVLRQHRAARTVHPRAPLAAEDRTPAVTTDAGGART